MSGVMARYAVWPIETSARRFKAIQQITIGDEEREDLGSIAVLGWGNK